MLFSDGFGLEGHFHAEGGAEAGIRMDGHGSVEFADPLLNTEEAEAGFWSGVGGHADAVIANDEAEPTAAAVDGDIDTPCLGVAGTVGEGFLDDAVGAGPIGLGELIEIAIEGDVDGAVEAAGVIAGEPLEGGAEADVIEHGRAEAHGEVADSSDDGIDEMFAFGGVSVEGGRVVMGALGMADLHA
jgi:hypothetical protein